MFTQHRVFRALGGEVTSANAMRPSFEDSPGGAIKDRDSRKSDEGQEGGSGRNVSCLPFRVLSFLFFSFCSRDGK